MKKILFVAMHRPGRSPSQRYRFEQYLAFLEKNGLSYEISFLINETDDQYLYSRGYYWKKFIIFLKSLVIRWKDIQRANQFDYIFIQREAFMTGTSYFERQFARSGVTVIYDLDDAIWLEDKNSANNKLQWLKNPQKIKKIIQCSQTVVAGNQFLADFARKYNSNVNVIPTTIDTTWYQSKFYKENKRICIGWTGSFSTIKHFERAIPILKRLKAIYHDNIWFKLIGDPTFQNEQLNIQGIAWNPETEVEDLCELDIGIMPLPDDEWSKGKCGFKGLQYMALGIPAIMSPVGVNVDIIKNGVNGFLADSDDEWEQKISQLIDSFSLRQSLGLAGRQTVVTNYSVEANKSKYLEIFNSR